MNVDKQKVIKRVHRILSIAADMAQVVDNSESCEVSNRIESISLHRDGYAEPGYSDPACGIIALGDWNSVSKYVPEAYGPGTQGERRNVSDLPKRICKLFERLGVEIEWCDEWCACGECGKMFRTSPDSYGWQRSYMETEDGSICHECIEKDPSSHLESLEGKVICNTISSIDPGDYGYVKLEECETGWHLGQTDDPKKVAKVLKGKGKHRFLFNLDGVGQFDMRWSVWIHESEK